MVQTDPSLQAKPDKEQIIILMPFFAEKSHLRSTGLKLTESAASNQRTTVFGQHRYAIMEAPMQNKSCIHNLSDGFETWSDRLSVVFYMRYSVRLFSPQSLIMVYKQLNWEVGNYFLLFYQEILLFYFADHFSHFLNFVRILF